MKNTSRNALRAFYTLFAVMATALALTACGDDSDGTVTGNDGTLSSQLVGSWVMFDENDGIIFNADGTGLYAEHYDEERGADVAAFTWVADEANRRVFLSYAEHEGDPYTEVYTSVSVSGDILTCVDSDGDAIRLQRRTFTYRTMDEVDAEGGGDSGDGGQSGGNTFDITASASSVSAQGGTLSFYVYNKDKKAINIKYPSGQSAVWQSLSTTRYAGGQDWLCKVTVPANTSSTAERHTYRFYKDDGSEAYFYVSQAGGGSGGSSEAVWGKVDVVAEVIGPGLAYSKEAQFYDGKTGKVDYVYYPSSGKYYVYGSYFCSYPDANGGKGVRYDAKKGYNSICVRSGAYFDYSVRPTVKYNWDVMLKFTLP